MARKYPTATDLFNALNYIGRTNQNRFCEIYNKTNPCILLFTKEVLMGDFKFTADDFTFLNDLDDNQYFNLIVDGNGVPELYYVTDRCNLIDCPSIEMIYHIIHSYEIDVTNILTEDELDKPRAIAKFALDTIIKSKQFIYEPQFGFSEMYGQFVTEIFNQLKYIPIVEVDDDVEFLYDFSEFYLRFIITQGYSINWKYSKFKCINKLLYLDKPFSAINNISKTINDITDLMVKSCRK